MAGHRWGGVRRLGSGRVSLGYMCMRLRRRGMYMPWAHDAMVQRHDIYLRLVSPLLLDSLGHVPLASTPSHSRQAERLLEADHQANFSIHAHRLPPPCCIKVHLRPRPQTSSWAMIPSSVPLFSVSTPPSRTAS